MWKKILARLFKREPRASSPYAACYKVLGIKPGASPDAVEKAYKARSARLKADLENFSHDHRLKQRMEELIKELNEAYEAVGGGIIACPHSASEIPGDDETEA